MKRIKYYKLKLEEIHENQKMWFKILAFFVLLGILFLCFGLYYPSLKTRESNQVAILGNGSVNSMINVVPGTTFFNLINHVPNWLSNEYGFTPEEWIETLKEIGWSNFTLIHDIALSGFSFLIISIPIFLIYMSSWWIYHKK